MKSLTGKISGTIMLTILSFISVEAQISPGDLSNAHTQFAGILNCTKCHVLGNKISNNKCLICHTEIQDRITIQKGYHSSVDVRGKECISCHSEHHGKNFQLIRFDIIKFDHNLTEYPLSVPHSKIQCVDCHNTKNITDQKIRAKKTTYLGLSTVCLTCHADYHQNKLSSDCLSCHNADSFKPVTKFNHSGSTFKLEEKHQNVDCVKCHKIEIINGIKTQEFVLPANTSCSSCHNDPHQNKNGQNCSQCHNVNSFQIISGVNNFNHNTTDYKLQGKHLTVNCKSCHKTVFTDPLKFKNCTDCHTDYHKKQFIKNGKSPDCSECHSVNGFTLFSYTIEQHNISSFPLQGSHLAIPCTDCHKTQKVWNFKGIGINCVDCHKDIHQTFITPKYYPEANCTKCHDEKSWDIVTFDHSITEFQITGAHKGVACTTCHIKKDVKGNIQQKFSGLSTNCSDCHINNHNNQFEKNGITDCLECHDTNNWKASKFNHDNTAFRLDGKHINVDCVKCHKPQQEGSGFYVNYKLKVFTCESCHS
jgi:hypothetical protein